MKINKTALVLTVVALLGLYLVNQFEKQYYLFVSFKDPGSQGVCYALSNDGLHWDALNGGEPVLVPPKEISRTRDPFVQEDKDGGFHLVYTCGGKPFALGYAYSKDLLEWKQFKRITVFHNNDSLLNVWAPELFYDREKEEWVIFWSSTIAGDFPKTLGQVEKQKYHRIYAMTTKDFETYSEPFLFFDPGYPVIDATVVKEDKTYFMVFKDERRWPLRKQLKTAYSESLYGPWKVNEPLTESWTEGPSVLKIDNETFVYYDKYDAPQHMEVISSKDGNVWSNRTEEAVFPPLYKHGSFIKITKSQALALKEKFAK